ncbi:ribosomal protein L11 methyltransferase [Catalinimonas alkaloidigena]|uniref:Ribosomal protein L11 methyltransferase n=1 Tax=Catalinimonas alkaloidigena TaxID=1075417 RepID=A0A1G9DXN3_9BACT|nr:50S ribosomal protein L11 methyltransferase [Catalinimonas alkaloidigena]SDK68608.1 ribosomal protein L11 methyltransferase [Catalinimonas alkaloidigena]
MEYTALHVQLAPDFADILVAELAQAGFDGFEENTTGFTAYGESQLIDMATVQEVLARYAAQTELTSLVEPIAKVNWNEAWERNFEPVVVGDQCIVRASFHVPMPEYAYEIVIDPKMSFGTGHHATTAMMLRYQLDIDHVGKRFLDVGCGTGILSIMAEKRGAAGGTAFDIEEWAVENTQENLALNDCHSVHVFCGEINRIAKDEQFEVVLANINRNIILAQLPQYVHHLKTGGILLLSGFYEMDIPELLHAANQLGLTLKQQQTLENWGCLMLKKPE